VNINTAWDTLITGAIILLAVMFDRFVSSLATRQISGTAPPAKELAAA
jgi:ribose/xylose/arabinose/galactoside ABC-type transport system permease subunit